MFTIKRGLSIEPFDDGCLVLVPGSDEVMHLVGDQARAFELARRGADHVPDGLRPTMAGLVELGVVDAPTWSRRRVLQLGGAAAAAAVATVALPSIAAAASPTDPPTTEAPAPTIPAGMYISQLGADTVERWDFSGSTTNVIPATAGLSGPQFITFGPDGRLYIASADNDTVFAWDGAALTAVVTGLGAPTGLAFAGNDLYVAAAGDGAVRRWTIGGAPTATTPVVTGIAHPMSLVLHGNDLYISNWVLDGTILRWVIGDPSGSPTVVVSGLGYPATMVVSGNELYIANQGYAAVTTWTIGSAPTATTNVVTGVSNVVGLLLVGNDLYMTRLVGGGAGNVVSKWTLGAAPGAHSDVVTGLDQPSALAITP